MDFCGPENIDEKIAKELTKELSITNDNFDPYEYAMGYICAKILIMEILVNMYVIENVNKFTEYLRGFKIGKTVIRDFLVNMEMKLPLNENYKLLIDSVIPQEDIDLMIISEKGIIRFDPDEVDYVYGDKYVVEDLNRISDQLFGILKGRGKALLLLKYLNVLIEHSERTYCNEGLDFAEVDLDKYSPSLAFGLYTMKEPLYGEYEELYKEVVRKFRRNSGENKVFIRGQGKETEELLEIVEWNLNYLRGELDGKL